MGKYRYVGKLQARLAALRLLHRGTSLRVGIGLLLIGSVAMAPSLSQRGGPVPDSATPLDPSSDEPPRSNAVFDAMDEYLRDHQIALAAATYAQRFRIPNTLAKRIYKAANDEDIRPDIAFGLVRAESSFRARVVSPAGAVGLTQVLPSTGRWIAPGTTRRDLMDPDTNLRVGFRYLRYLYEKYDGNEALALTAYNRGPGTVDRHLRQGRNPDNGYVEMVRSGHSHRHTGLMNVRFGNRRS